MSKELSMSEKFSELDNLYECPVSSCPYCNMGLATCDDYTEDHCFKKLYHQETDAKVMVGRERDENGNMIWEHNKVAFGEEPLHLLEPWVRDSDVPKHDKEMGATRTVVRFIIGNNSPE